MGFVVIWLIGDLCNLSGALMADLLPTVILIAVYVSQSSTLARPTRGLLSNFSREKKC